MIPALAVWGDNVAEQAFRTVGTPANSGYTERLFTRGAVGGETSTEVKNRFLADRTRRNWNQVIWVGHNSFNATTIKADIAAMIADMTHTRYVVMGVIPNHNDTDEQGPSGTDYQAIVALNNDLRTLYGAKFFDVHEFLRLRGQDAGDTASINFLGPSSTDQPSSVHLIAAAYDAVTAELRRIMKELGYLSGSVAEAQVSAAGPGLPPQPAISITSSATGTIAEDRPYAIQLTANILNPEWSILTGPSSPDAALFYFDKTNQYSRSILRMRGQNFETPADADTDNDYVVQIQLSDGRGNTATQTHTVSVTDVVESDPFTEADDYFARFQTIPDEPFRGVIDTLIRRLVAFNLWDKLPALHLSMNIGSHAGLLNVKSATGTLLNNGALHVPWQGFLGDGVNDYIEGIGLRALDAGLNPGNFGAFFYSILDIEDGNADVGMSASDNIRIIGHNSGELQTRPLSSSSHNAAVDSGLGLYGFQRTSPREGFLWNSGEQIGTDLPDAAELPTGNLRFLASQSALYSKRIMAAGGVIKGGTIEDWGLLDAALTEYVDTILELVPTPPASARCIINFDGADGATTTVDEGGGKTVNFVGAAALETDDPLEGTASLQLPASPSSYVWMADSPDWQLPLQFTLRCRFRTTDLGVSPKRSTLIGHNNTVDDQRSYQLAYNYQGRLQFDYSVDGIDVTTIQTGTGVISINTKYEVTVDRDATGNIRLYLANLDAVDTHANMVASAVFAGEFWDSNARLTIGCNENESNQVIGKTDSFKHFKNETLVGNDLGYDPISATPRLRIEFEGADGATTYVAEEGAARPLTFHGAAQIDTASALVGNASLLLPSVGSFVSSPDHADWDLPLRFTLRARIRLTSLQGAGHLSAIMSHYSTASNNRGWEFMVTDLGALRFSYSTDGTSAGVVATSSANGLIVINHTYEVQADRDPTGKIRLYIADLEAVNKHANMVASSTFLGDFHRSTTLFRIGDIQNADHSFLGRIDSPLLDAGRTLTGSDSGYDPTGTGTPVEPFKVRDILRYPGSPDLSSYGLRKDKVEYESAYWPTSTHGAPNISYIRNTRIPAQKNANPGLTHLIIDIETWSLSSSAEQPIATALQYHLDVLECYRDLWPELKVAYYGEVPIRSLSHLTGSASENVTRRANWMAQNDAIKALADEVDFLCPSCYMIGSLSRNFATATTTQKNSAIALMGTYVNDMVNEAKRLAPNKEVWIVFWNEYHNLDASNGWPSPQPPRPQYLPADYWRAQLDVALSSQADKLALWSRASGSPNFSFSIPWWTETVDFINDNAITL